MLRRAAPRSKTATMNPPSIHTEMLRVPATHPALPGHFPGRPLVPGVVLLDRVVAAVERVWHARVSGFAQVKFRRPLLPEHMAELYIERGAQLHFRIRAADELLASGIAELAE